MGIEQRLVHRKEISGSSPACPHLFRTSAFLIAWLIMAPAWAFLPGQPVGMLNPQVQPANAIAGLPAVNDDLTAGGYPIAGGICSEWGHQVPCNNHYSTTRASTKYVSASDGLFVSVPSNVQAMGSGNGSLIEEVRTNDALWSRDMTNAVWVKTTMTTALNAVGIDGTANSATTLTATGASAMAVQTITLASQADNYSVFLKRVTGSGTINICLAATACASPTACTVTSTTAFTRCTVTATVLNPIVGVQIVTNGDAVIADFNQMEPGGFPTSPCLTTNATSTRSADSISVIGNLLTALQSSAVTLYVSLPIFPVNAAARILDYNAVNTPPIQAVQSSTSAISFNGSTATASLPSGTFQNTTTRIVESYMAGNQTIVINGGTEGSGVGSFPAVTSAHIGSQSGTSIFLNNYLIGLAVWNSQLPAGSRKSLSK